MNLFVIIIIIFNLVDIDPTGRSYASGAEDGYVRLHHFDMDYLEMKDPVPEEDDEEGGEEGEEKQQQEGDITQEEKIPDMDKKEEVATQ
jgi:hypothetical protein